MPQIIIKYRLKADVSREQFEHWAQTVDYPSMRGLQRVSRFTNYRTVRNLFTEDAPSMNYIEFFEIPDLDGFIREDMTGPVVQKVMNEFMQLVDSPEFLVAEELV
jgi:REDY-like protein HapK